MTPGVLDETAVGFFTEGQCHALADAVHRETGWDVVLVKMPCDGECAGCVEDPWEEVDEVTGEPLDGRRECEVGYTTHIMTVTPEGLLLDAFGVRTPEQVAAAYGITVEATGTGSLWVGEDGVVGLERYAGEVGEWLADEVEGWADPRADVAEEFVEAALARAVEQRTLR